MARLGWPAFKVFDRFREYGPFYYSARPARAIRRKPSEVYTTPQMVNVGSALRPPISMDERTGAGRIALGRHGNIKATRRLLGIDRRIPKYQANGNPEPLLIDAIGNISQYGQQKIDIYIGITKSEW